jgi:nucleoside-diphosphate-sugar epimerase
MNFLITGCSSYIARYVAEKLLSDGDRIIGISRTDPDIEHENFCWISHDLSKGSCELDTSSVDIIIHMAAQSLLNKSAAEYLSSNILITNHVGNMAKKLQPRAIIYTSSMKIYGEIRTKEATEDIDIINPELYGLTKYFGEKILQEIKPTISLRMPGVVSVGSHGWIDGIYKKLRRNETLSIFNSPYNHVIHALDIYGIIRQICDDEYFKTDSFNVCAGGLSTSLEVVELIKEGLCSESVIDVKEQDSVATYVLSNEKLLNLYKPMDVKDTIGLYIKEMNNKLIGKGDIS